MSETFHNDDFNTYYNDHAQKDLSDSIKTSILKEKNESLKSRINILEPSNELLRNRIDILEDENKILRESSKLSKYQCYFLFLLTIFMFLFTIFLHHSQCSLVFTTLIKLNGLYFYYVNESIFS